MITFFIILAIVLIVLIFISKGKDTIPQGSKNISAKRTYVGTCVGRDSDIQKEEISENGEINDILDSNGDFFWGKTERVSDTEFKNEAYRMFGSEIVRLNSIGKDFEMFVTPLTHAGVARTEEDDVDRYESIDKFSTNYKMELFDPMGYQIKFPSERIKLFRLKGNKLQKVDAKVVINKVSKKLVVYSREQVSFAVWLIER